MLDNVRELRGNPGKRRSNYVRVVSAIPNPPIHLAREAKAEWRRVTPELHRLGLVARLDRAVLSLYCQTWARWVALDKILDREGLILTKRALDKNGDVVELEQYRHPAWLTQKEAATLIVGLAKELGVSPNARLRMRAPDRPPAREEDLD